MLNTEFGFRHINSGLEHSLTLLSVQPRYQAQEDNFNLVLQCWLHLCYLLITLGNTYQVSLLAYYMGVAHLISENHVSF